MAACFFGEPAVRPREEEDLADRDVVEREAADAIRCRGPEVPFAQFDPLPGVADAVNVFAIEGGIPGETVTFYVGLVSGTTMVANCVELDIVPAIAIASAVVGADGTASIAVFVDEELEEIGGVDLEELEDLADDLFDEDDLDEIQLLYQAVMLPSGQTTEVISFQFEEGDD